MSISEEEAKLAEAKRHQRVEKQAKEEQPSSQHWYDYFLSRVLLGLVIGLAFR